MKHLKLLFLLNFLLSLCIQAQIDKPEKGSVWVYNYANVSMCGPIVSEYTKDVTFGGKQAMVLQQTLFNMCTYPSQPKIDTVDWGQNIIALEDSMVLLWRDNGFDVLYDFGAEVGEKRYLRASERDTLSEEVLGKGVDDNLGCYLIVRYTRSNKQDFQYPYEIQDTIYERLFGGSGYIIPEDQFAEHLDGQSGGPLVCFSNSAGRFSDGEWSPNGKSCQNIVDKLSVEQLALENIFTIYPNPSKGIINIKTNQKPARMEVYSSLGELVFSSESDFETPSLPSQVYVVKLWRDDGLAEVHRVVVE